MRQRLDFAHVAVHDALRWVDETGDAAAILAAVEEIRIGDLSALAARQIEKARKSCREQRGVRHFIKSAHSEALTLEGSTQC